MRNLDLDCMRMAQEVIAGLEENKTDATKYENCATKALAVLANDGPYACFLFLGQGSNIHQKKKIQRTMSDLAKRSMNITIDGTNSFTDLAKIAENLDDYLLLKRLWERMLTYLRYQAKCLQKPENHNHDND